MSAVPPPEAEGGAGEHESLPDRALDVVLYAPVGLLVTALDEFPTLVARGRQRLGVRVRNAHAIGRVAVDLGGKELGRRAERLRSRGPGDTTIPGVGVNRPPGPVAPTGASSPSRAASPGPAQAPRPRSPAAPRPPTTPNAPVGPRAAPPGPPPTEPGSRPSLRTVPGPSGGETPPTGDTPRARPARRTPRAAGSEASRPTVDLAIPGYDTLSASQVVKRLDGLGEAELQAVFRYESSSRGRRTILHRIRQIQGDAKEPPGRPQPERPGGD